MMERGWMSKSKSRMLRLIVDERWCSFRVGVEVEEFVTRTPQDRDQTSVALPDRGCELYVRLGILDIFGYYASSSCLSSSV